MTNPFECQNSQAEQMPGEETATLESRKRKRPSYAAYFPSLDEFSEAGSSSSEAADQQKSKVPSLHPSNYALQPSRIITLPIAPQNLPQIVDPVRTHQSQTPAGLVAETPNYTSTAEQSGSDNTRRCNHCILVRRKCDGVQPTCGLCSKSGMRCVYDKAGVTRSYLESLQKRPVHFRRVASNGVAIIPVHPRRRKLNVGNWNQRLREDASQENPRRQDSSTGGPSIMLGGRLWSFEDHIRLRDALDRDYAVPEDDHFVFNDTTHIYEEFRRSDSRLIDRWVQQAAENLELNWAERPAHNMSQGLTANLRVRSGLLSVRSQIKRPVGLERLRLQGDGKPHLGQ